MNDKKFWRWRVLYKAPVADMIRDPDNVETWRKVFYFNIYECPTELDLKVKIIDLKQLYNMKDEYIEIQDLNEFD